MNKLENVTFLIILLLVLFLCCVLYKGLEYYTISEILTLEILMLINIIILSVLKNKNNK